MISAGVRTVVGPAVASIALFAFAGWSDIGLPGDEGGEILVTADCASREPACGVVEEAVVDLQRTPRRRSLRVLLRDEIEERSAPGIWADVPSERRRDTLAHLHLVTRTDSETGPTVILSQAGRRRTPGWLVHAALRGAESAGGRARVLTERGSVLAQLVNRASTRPTSISDHSLAAGVPSIELTGLESGDPPRSRMLAAIVRRLDALEGRPLAEDQYLVLGARVWLRRDLYWGGFVLWLALLWRGRPGRWRREAGSERLNRGREYMSRFVFRFAFLAAILLAPVHALPLLMVPAAVLLVCSRQPPWWATVAALLPAAVFAAGWLWTLATTEAGVGAFPAGPLVVGVALGCFASVATSRDPAPSGNEAATP